MWYFFGIYSHPEIGIFRDEKIRDVITEPSRRSLTPSASAATHFSDLAVPGCEITVATTAQLAKPFQSPLRYCTGHALTRREKGEEGIAIEILRY